MIRCKPGVKIQIYSPAIHIMLHELMMLDHNFTGLRLPKSLWITSIWRPARTKPSRHPTHEAIDIRSWNFSSRAAKRRFRQVYEEVLNNNPTVSLLYGRPGPNPAFRVLFEPTVE